MELCQFFWLVIHSLPLAGYDSKLSFDTVVAVGDIDAFIKTTRPDGKDEVKKSRKWNI